jgi:hypothetical protein
VLVELPAGDDVELTADRDDQAVATALGRKPELRHLRLRISNRPGTVPSPHRIRGYSSRRRRIDPQWRGSYR